VSNNRFTLFCDGSCLRRASDHDFLAHSITWQFAPGTPPGFELPLTVLSWSRWRLELNTARDGLGYVVWEAWQTMRTEYLYAGIVVIAFIGCYQPLYYERSRER